MAVEPFTGAPSGVPAQSPTQPPTQPTTPTPVFNGSSEPPEGHDEAMLKAAAEAGISINGVVASEGATSEPAPDNQGDTGDVSARPDFVPEKFWDADKGEPRLEEWAKSTTALEGELSNTKAELARMKGEGASEAFNLDNMSQEFAETGELSDATYETLEAAGIPRHYVDMFIAGQEAVAGAQRTELLSKLELNDASYQQMTEWAKANLSADEIEEYNRKVDNPDRDVVETAIQRMQAKYQAAQPSQGQNHIDAGNGGQSAGGDESPYTSRQAMMTDMNDPKYGSDPEFTARVQRRLMKSNVI